MVVHQTKSTLLRMLLDFAGRRTTGTSFQSLSGSLHGANSIAKHPQVVRLQAMRSAADTCSFTVESTHTFTYTENANAVFATHEQY